MLAIGAGALGLGVWGFQADFSASHGEDDVAAATEVYTWGSGQFGELGDGSARLAQWAPSLVTALAGENIVDVVAGFQQSAVLTADGRVLTFGCGADGRLGHGWAVDLPNETLPREVSGLRGVRVKQVAVGARHMAAVGEDGSLHTWGSHHFGELGHGNAKRGEPGQVPAEALGGAPVKQVACGSKHTVALTEAGDLFSWGYGREGQLGHGDKNGCKVPKKVAGLPPVRSIACGSAFTMAVTTEGELWAWGDDSYGNLGQGQQVKFQKAPKRVDALRGQRIASVSTGELHAVAVTEAGDVFTFGCGNDGQTGQGDRSDLPLPKKVEGLKHPTLLIAAGGGHTLCVDVSGRVHVFGRGRSGQLGRGDALESVGSNRRDPVPVSFFDGRHVVGVAAGADHSVALVAKTAAEDVAARAEAAEAARAAVAASDDAARRRAVIDARRAAEKADRARREAAARAHTKEKEARSW